MTTPTPPVTFVYADWIAMFPQFAPTVSSTLAGQFFIRASNLYANSVSNPAFANGVPFLTTQLYLLTAHLAELAQRAGGGGSVVGRMASASEGSVNVGLDVGASGSPSEAYYTQTQYGFEFWQANAPFRTMRYVALRPVIATAIFPGRYRWGR